MISEKNQIKVEPNLQKKIEFFQEIYQQLINMQYIDSEFKFNAFNDLILYCYLYLPSLRDDQDVKSLYNHTKILSNFPTFNLSFQDMIDRYDFIEENRNLIKLSNVKQMKTFLNYDDIFECQLVYDMNGEILLCTLDQINDEEDDENEQFNEDEN